jgi:uncharacterized protein YdiU (UPF0061 family)
MAAGNADFTLTFRLLGDAARGPEGDPAVGKLFADPAGYESWAMEWRRRLAQETVLADERAASMQSVNPIFIPRNHLVESAIVAAVERGDVQPFERLLDIVTKPYDDRRGMNRYAVPARPEELVSATFCGT